MERKRFYGVEMVHIRSDEPETFTLTPHIGPEGWRGDSVDVRASRLECWGSVDHVIYDREMTSIIMRFPGAVCTLEKDTLTCRPRE